MKPEKHKKDYISLASKYLLAYIGGMKNAGKKIRSKKLTGFKQISGA